MTPKVLAGSTVGFASLMVNTALVDDDGEEQPGPDYGFAGP